MSFSSLPKSEVTPRWTKWLECYWECVKAFRGRLAWARDPQGHERNLGELVSQFQYNYDVMW